MKRLLLTAVLLGAAACPAAEEEEGPRNPFWPNGYEGVRYPITLEPRFKPQPKVEAASTNAAARRVRRPAPESAEALAARKAAEAAAALRAAEDKLWADAIKTLDFGPAFSFSSTGRSGSVLTIDGRCYGVGDLVSRNVGDLRFTWSVESISNNGKLKLKRLQHRPIRKNEEK